MRMLAAAVLLAAAAIAPAAAEGVSDSDLGPAEPLAQCVARAERTLATVAPRTTVGNWHAEASGIPAGGGTFVGARIICLPERVVLLIEGGGEKMRRAVAQRITKRWHRR